MKVINSLLFNIFLRLFFSVQPSLLCYFENIKQIRIGNNSIIDALVTLKGGIKPQYKLNIGKSVVIRRNCYISSTEGIIKIGNDVLIAHNTWVAGHGRILIGSNTLIGPNVVIVSSNHNLNSEIYPSMLAPEIRGEVKIGSNCWIGANSTIVPNVSIGNNCIIAGGSVVTNNFESNSIIAGNPAKIIKKNVLKDIIPYKV